MKFVKKPTVIDAVQWTGENIKEVADLVGEYTAEIRGGSLFINGIMCPIGYYIINDCGAICTYREDVFNKYYSPYKD